MTRRDQFFQEHPKEQKRQPAELKSTASAGWAFVFAAGTSLSAGPYTVTIPLGEGRRGCDDEVFCDFCNYEEVL